MAGTANAERQSKRKTSTKTWADGQHIDGFRDGWKAAAVQVLNILERPSLTRLELQAKLLRMAGLKPEEQIEL